MIDFSAAVRNPSGRTLSVRNRSARVTAWLPPVRIWEHLKFIRIAKFIRVASAILIAMASLTIAGCSANGENQVVYPNAPPPPPASDSPQAAGGNANGVVGVWEGLSLANCSTSAPNRCNAQEKITLTLVEGTSGGLAGYYRCSYGTMDCLGQNETAKIVSATLNGEQMTARVQMDDGTSCIYTGRTGNSVVNGGYSCYGGGSLIESGSWNGRRTY